MYEESFTRSATAPNKKNKTPLILDSLEKTSPELKALLYTA